jgi:hypothetical protein
MEIDTFILNNKTGHLHPLSIVFDTGAYMTTINTATLVRAGYNVDAGIDAEFNVDELIRFEDFSRVESRFGLWMPGQVAAQAHLL